jgi:hypothetical protein
MSAPQERPGVKLTPEAQQLIDTYFSRVHGALLVAAAGECEEAVEDLRSHVLEQLEGSAGTPADVTRVLAEIGAPEALAAQCAEFSAETLPALAGPAEEGSPFSGRVLGIPFDLRPPTAERVASRWWDPRDPHLFVPRLFGIGWTVNFGAAAVGLGLVRPDDEDAPFGEVSGTWLAVALLLPLALAGVLAALALIFQAGLPGQVATHYGLDGAPDGFSSKGAALLLPAGMTLLGIVMAAWPWARRRAPLARVAMGALATMLAGISVSAYAQSAATAHGNTGATILLVGLAATFVLTFALLVTLSRVGRAAEQRRDLARTSKKGRV